MNTRALVERSTRLGCWLLTVAATGSMGLAGEPIRFVSPNAEVKPLRSSFAVAEVQSPEDADASVTFVQPASAEEASTAGVGIPIHRKPRTSDLALAGEPIRFFRPKADDKPLRFNFAAEKIQSREGLSSSSLQPSSTAGASISGGRIVVNPKARAAALARRNWASSDKDDSEPTSTTLGTDLADSSTESTESLDLEPARSRADGSLFSVELGLSPRGPGSTQPGPAPASGDRIQNQNQGLGNSRFGADNRTALRGLMGDTFESPGAGAGSAGSRGDVRAGFGPAGGFPGSPPVTGGDPRREGAGMGLGGSALAPRVPADSGLGRDSGIANPAGNSPPETRRSAFDPSERPLRSNFDLPARPR